MTVRRILLALPLLALLPACQTLSVGQALTETTDAYDGAWIGNMSVTYRKPECRLTRGGLRVKVEGGRMEGQARFTDVLSEFTGLIDETGAVQYAVLRGQRFAKDDVELIGTFEERSASGTWSNKLCRGEWVLRKAR